MMETVNQCLHRFTHLCLKSPTEIVVWYYDTFENNLIEGISKYLIESCRPSLD